MPNANVGSSHRYDGWVSELRCAARGAHHRGLSTFQRTTRKLMKTPRTRTSASSAPGLRIPIASTAECCKEERHVGWAPWPPCSCWPARQSSRRAGRGTCSSERSCAGRSISLRCRCWRSSPWSSSGCPPGGCHCETTGCATQGRQRLEEHISLVYPKRQVRARIRPSSRAPPAFAPNTARHSRAVSTAHEIISTRRLHYALALPA